MNRFTTLLAALIVAAAGCESGNRDYDRYGYSTENDRGRLDQGQAAASRESSERRVDATARTGGADVRRDGDRTHFTMAYPTGERNSSVLLVEKTVPNQIRLNQPFQYEIKVTNIAGATLDDVRIREDVPEGVNVTAAQPERQGQGAEAGWQLGALKPKESKTIQVSAVAQRQGQLGTCVMASYQPSLCAALNVVNPQLQVSRKAPERIDICEPLAIEYTVTNSGSGTTEPVTIREELPEGLTTDDGKNVITMSAGELREGQSKTGTVRLKATRAGTFSSRAVASSPGGLQAQTEEARTVVTQPKLGINIEGPDAEYVGRPIAYRVTVTNEGDAAARDAVVAVAVPGATKLVNVGTEGRTNRNAIQWALGTLEPKATKSVTFTLSGTEASNLSTVARARAACAEDVTDTAQTRLMTIPALVLEAVDLSDPVHVGENVVYKITVTNQGSGADHRISITAKLPPELQYVSSKGETDAKADGPNITFAPVATLEAGRTATWELTAKADKPGDVRFEVQLTSESLTKPAYENEPTRLY